MKKNKFYIAVIMGVFVIGFIAWSFNDKPEIATTKTENSIELLATTAKPQAPVHLKDPDGNPVNFADFAGKVVFINNWATWCRPCTMEMPSIQRLKENFKGKDLAFVMISYDRNPKKSIRWMANQGYSLPVYIKGKDLPRRYVTRGIPATFVLDKQGRMIYRHVGMSNYSSPKFISKMEKWLAE